MKLGLPENVAAGQAAKFSSALPRAGPDSRPNRRRIFYLTNSK
jgi:hypothetical protein